MALEQALDRAEKTVYIEISRDDLAMLKSEGYKLCFAKKVGDAAYNVVWHSYTKYLEHNLFSWWPVYQLFGSNQFMDGLPVREATNRVSVEPGEQSVLDESGILGPATPGGPPTGLTMVNRYGSIHPGANQQSAGIDGGVMSAPIYVAVNDFASGSATLTPVEKVLVWFQKDVVTGTMFSGERPKSVEIDLTNANQATRLYADQKWTTP